MFEFDFLAVVDGGSRGNGAANEGYGSYVLSTRDGRKETIRLESGRGVTKQRVYDPAEYRALIAGLEDLVGRIQRAGKAPSGYSLLIHTDSQLMVGQLTQGWKIKAAIPSTPLRTGLRLRSGQASVHWWTRQTV